MKTLTIALSLLFIAVFISCKKDGASGSSYPKQVNIVYKVSSTTTTSAAIVQYRDETGTIKDVPNAALPYTKNISRSINRNDVLSLGYGTNINQTVKLEILVNNVSVKSQTFTTTAGAITYLFE